MLIRLTELAPKKTSPLESCGMPASASAASLTKYMKRGDRVLILGASGGVGTCVWQFAKLYGASFIAGTSTASELVLSLGADRVFDYRTTNWWEVPKNLTSFST